MTKTERYILVSQRTGLRINVGDTVNTFRGEPRVVTGWTPGNERSTGRVSLKTEGDMWSHDFFPSIIGAIITTAD